MNEILTTTFENEIYIGVRIFIIDVHLKDKKILKTKSSWHNYLKLLVIIPWLKKTKQKLCPFNLHSPEMSKFAQILLTVHANMLSVFLAWFFYRENVYPYF